MRNYEELLNMLLLMVDTKYVRLSNYMRSKCTLKSRRVLL